MIGPVFKTLVRTLTSEMPVSSMNILTSEMLVSDRISVRCHKVAGILTGEMPMSGRNINQ